MAAPTIVTASIGAAGGVVELGGFTLTIPPGALTETREITVEGAADATVEGYSLSSRLYRLQPEGLTFALPATVSIPFVPGAESPALFWSLADNSGHEDLHGTVMGAAMAAAVTHFSSGYVGSVLPPACNPGDFYCFNEAPEGRRRCTADRTYAYDPCPARHMCSTGRCLPWVCEAGTNRCRGAGAVEICLFGREPTVTYCWSGSSCQTSPEYWGGAICVQQVCPPGEASCAGTTTRRLCNPGGSGYSYTACPSGNSCILGVCRPRICTSGTFLCVSPTHRRQCSADGLSHVYAPCPTRNACTGAGLCNPWVCTPGMATCADPTTRSVCNADGLGSVSTVCPSGQRCNRGACATPVCTPGAFS
ncbi:MAG: hypothetical protein IPN17_36390, partial [Deltaproteobacteria bacterium]|nr:hypothetical protein [Deltaproteobacteria bacterium]